MATAFGEFLKYARQQKRMTQFQLGIALNMDPGQLSKWERGELQRPSPDFATRAAVVLGVPLEEMGLAMIGVFPPAYAGLRQRAVEFPLDMTAEEWAAIVHYARQLRLSRGK
ncbi:MAG: helix-turn-helix domain-containing protein [Thermomicrobiales bacterium]